jgi:hypothetical protein
MELRTSSSFFSVLTHLTGKEGYRMADVNTRFMLGRLASAVVQLL